MIGLVDSEIAKDGKTTNDNRQSSNGERDPVRETDLHGMLFVYAWKSELERASEHKKIVKCKKQF